ncbi:SNARE protein, putative [Plasmodium gallinaceum]|uniref:SNARE protein, putative n=1 Tax=Plasmodium gallinaceum TaxID=5849 RepID=A0A1J1GQM3_PLAGA|nr:SNARE protein, putative [Plasmodium gallinaceum]CRG94720.1 SNARE protein, putative [Plasmodium gallinaceum]
MKSEKVDPFYEAKHEVDISVNNLQNLYNKWNNIPDKNSPLAKEKYTLIKEEIKYLNEDLNDLNNSINVVKKNLYKFNISNEEIENRTKSLKIIQKILNGITNNINYNVQKCNDNIMIDYDKVILKRQDNDLEELAESAERLHNAAITINTELKDQQKLLDELENEMDYSNEKMNFVTKKISDYLKTNNPKVLSLILYLSLIAFILLFVLIVS